MKNAKTIGGITGFSVKQETATKWVLTRTFQTRFLEALFQLGRKSTTMSDPRKCLRYSEIRRSNEMGRKVMVTQFINPFG